MILATRSVRTGIGYLCTDTVKIDSVRPHRYLWVSQVCNISFILGEAALGLLTGRQRRDPGVPIALIRWQGRVLIIAEARRLKYSARLVPSAVLLVLLAEDTGRFFLPRSRGGAIFSLLERK